MCGGGEVALGMEVRHVRMHQTWPRGRHSVSFLSILLFLNYLLLYRTSVSTRVSSALLVHSTILPISQPLLFIHIYDCAAAERVHGGLFSRAALVGHEHCQQHCEDLGPACWQPSRDAGTVRILQNAGKGGGSQAGEHPVQHLWILLRQLTGWLLDILPGIKCRAVQGVQRRTWKQRRGCCSCSRNLPGGGAASHLQPPESHTWAWLLWDRFLCHPLLFTWQALRSSIRLTSSSSSESISSAHS